jgi:hypothetical protein
MCVAVGWYGATNSHPPWPLIEMYNGKRWSVVWTGEPGVSSKSRMGSLEAVSCTSPTFCVAAGQHVTGLPPWQMYVVWNGHDWSMATLPPLLPNLGEGGIVYTNGVSCPTVTFCVAVGRVPGRSFIEAWNGHTWTLKLTPAGIGLVLDSVSCRASHWCAAIGTLSPTASNGPGMVEAYHGYGTAWSATTTTTKLVKPAPRSLSCPSVHVCFGLVKGHLLKLRF